MFYLKLWLSLGFISFLPVVGFTGPFIFKKIYYEKKDEISSEGKDVSGFAWTTLPKLLFWITLITLIPYQLLVIMLILANMGIIPLY